MNQTSKNIDELLIRILDDTATRADLRVFAEWIRTEENRKYFEQYKKIWHTTTGVQCDDQVVKEGWQDYKQFMRVLPERRKRAVEEKILLMYDNIKYIWRGEQRCISLQRIAGLEYRRLTRNTKNFFRW